MSAILLALTCGTVTSSVEVRNTAGCLDKSASLMQSCCSSNFTKNEMNPEFRGLPRIVVMSPPTTHLNPSDFDKKYF